MNFSSPPLISFSWPFFYPLLITQSHTHIHIRSPSNEHTHSRMHAYMHIFPQTHTYTLSLSQHSLVHTHTFTQTLTYIHVNSHKHTFFPDSLIHIQKDINLAVSIIKWRKLRNDKPGQYVDEWPPGNAWRCKLVCTGGIMDNRSDVKLRFGFVYAQIASGKVGVQHFSPGYGLISWTLLSVNQYYLKIFLQAKNIFLALNDQQNVDKP